MRHTFTFLLLLLPMIANGQNFEVSIDSNAVGTYSLSTEANAQIHTFAELHIEVVRLFDTTRFDVNSHYIESDSGMLQSIVHEVIAIDTVRYQAFFLGDTVRVYTKVDSSKYFRDQIIYGPQKIKSLCKARLVNIGDTLSVYTFMADLARIVQVDRTLMGYKIENAQKLRVVKESIVGGTTLSNIYDPNFDLVESIGDSPFGEISFSKRKKTYLAPLFPTNLYELNQVQSNILFPDPNSISALHLRLTIDKAVAQPMEINSVWLPIDSTSNNVQVQLWSSLDSIAEDEYIPCTQFNSWVSPPDSAFRSVIDSISSGYISSFNKVNAFATYLKQQSTDHWYLKLAQMARASDFPSRIVLGYVYEKWFWTPKFWVEVGISGMWIPYDINSTLPNNTLRLPIKRSAFAQGPSVFYQSVQSMRKLEITAERYQLGGKETLVSKQAIPYYLEQAIYENEGLGLKFDLPKGYVLTADGTNAPSKYFLELGSDNGGTIKLEQVILKTDEPVKSRLMKEIKSFTQMVDRSVSYNSKYNFWLAESSDIMMLAYQQGSSMILIAIDDANAKEVVAFLVKKNLTIEVH